MDIVVPYFKAGLENNEFCVWITSQPLQVEEAKEALRKGISDFEVYVWKGQIEVVSYSDWYIKDYITNSNKSLKIWIEKLNHKVAADYEGLRLSEDPIWAEAHRKDFVYYEKR